jgi:hypothetical protein
MYQDDCDMHEKLQFEWNQIEYRACVFKAVANIAWNIITYDFETS